MGVIQPEQNRSKAHFGCGGAALAGFTFWCILACCFLLGIIGTAPELGNGDAELAELYAMFTEMFTGSFAFCLSMAAAVLVFGGYGIYRRVQKSLPTGSYDLNTVILFFGLFLGGVLLAAAIPTLALTQPGVSAIFKWIGVLLGIAYFAYGLLMLWLLLLAYENYQHE